MGMYGLCRLPDDCFVTGGNIVSKDWYPMQRDTLTEWGWSPIKNNSPFLLYFTKEGVLKNYIQVDVDSSFQGSYNSIETSAQGVVYAGGFYADKSACVDTGSWYAPPCKFKPPRLQNMHLGLDTLRLRAGAPALRGDVYYPNSGARDILFTASDEEGNYRWAQSGGAYNRSDHISLVRKWTDSTLFIVGQAGSGAKFGEIQLDTIPFRYSELVKAWTEIPSWFWAIYDTTGKVLRADYLPQLSAYPKFGYQFMDAVADSQSNLYVRGIISSSVDSINILGDVYSMQMLMRSSGMPQNEIDRFKQGNPVSYPALFKLNALGHLIWIRLYKKESLSGSGMGTRCLFFSSDQRLTLSENIGFIRPQGYDQFPVLYEIDTANGKLTKLLALDGGLFATVTTTDNYTQDDCGHIYWSGHFRQRLIIEYPTRDTIFKLENPDDVDVFLLKFRREGALYLPREEKRLPTSYESKDGSLRIIAAEGEQPYNYAWSHNPSLNTAEAKDLAPGIYQVTVTDARGCKQMAHFNLKERPVAFRNLITRPADSGQNNGEIRISAFGGRPPYQYSIDDGNTWQNERIFRNLPAGVYPTAAKDMSGTIIKQETEVRMW